ncbi:DUF1642 domain-containing protein [Streptococcus sp. 27098_8_91]|uniref:DUF1642 domain-containing protein n=1 Tax=Streptococcus sp. 27098_8_91 TaxID=3003663 RepID=UPI00352FC479
MNKQELINVPRILFPIGTEILIKGKIVGLKVLADRFVENIVKLDYGEQIIAPNDAIYVKDEPQPVKVPQFVAEIIEYYKGKNATLYDALREKNFNKQYNEWLMNEQDAYNKVARAWLDGYEVEEEKRYLVKIKAVDQYLVRVKDEDFLGFLQSRLRSNFTRKELEEAGFGWVFDCEGIEIKEV